MVHRQNRMIEVIVAYIEGANGLGAEWRQVILCASDFGKGLVGCFRQYGHQCLHSSTLAQLFGDLEQDESPPFSLYGVHFPSLKLNEKSAEGY